MHECRRVFNGETAETGPVQAATAEVIDMVTLGPPREESNDEAENHDDTDAEECDDKKKPRPLQVFAATASMRDDWLHRGFALMDLDLYHYSITIERVRLTNVLKSCSDPGNVFPFEPHYILASTHCQQIIKIPRTVPRLVGAVCPRPDLSEGED